MNANELRIGNLYQGYDNSIQEIDLQFFVNLDNGVDVDEMIKSSIPINEAHLIGFGFEKANDTDCWYKIRLLNDWSFLFINPKHKMAEISISQHGCVLKFGGMLHELQNLYFALTKQELCVTQP